jgi:uncharacterized membrane protein YidH (DUF202 family)
VEGAVKRVPRSAKIGFALVALHYAAWAYVAVAKPEYDGHDLPALIFWIVLSHVMLIAGGLLLLFNVTRWFVNRPNDGL